MATAPALPAPVAMISTFRASRIASSVIVTRHEVKRRHVCHDLRVQVGPLIGPQLGGDPIDGRWVHAVEQALFGDPEVAFWVQRRHASLVAEKHRHPAPVDLDLGQQLIGPYRRRAPGHDKASGAVAQRQGDLSSRGLRDLLRSRKNNEFAQVDTLTLP